MIRLKKEQKKLSSKNKNKKHGYKSSYNSPTNCFGNASFVVFFHVITFCLFKRGWQDLNPRSSA